MIRTTYLRPEGAAAILDIEVDELLIAAAEGRVRLYGLVHVLAQSELGRYEVDEGSETNESGQSRWLCVKSEFHRFTFVPVSQSGVINIIVDGSVSITDRLSDEDEDGLIWRLAPELASSDFPPIVVSRQAIFFKRADIEVIRDQEVQPKAGSVKDLLEPMHHSYLSKKLEALIAAARYWWANADRDDPSTHPDMQSISAWLVDRGLTKSLADKATTIIRPEWAHFGRKPER